MNKFWKSAGYWVAELVVIFIGVYLAFLLNGYRTHRQNEHKRQQIYTALYRNFAGFAKIKENNTYADSVYVDPFIKGYEKGEMPRLKIWPFIKFGVNDKNWYAILQAGGIDLLNVKMVFKVSGFFYALNRLSQASNHFNKMSDEYLIPHDDKNISWFYNTKTKKLRPRYYWYINFLRYYERQINYMSEWAKKLEKDMRSKMSESQLQKIKADSTR